uniref:Photosystem II reaction center protein Psb30 n=2 Tax=Gloeobacter TaxID=33071 RepID=PSB30_GLOVI|nr:RecName: Full=Photosystem II reaction center protein Psb30; AltName: Full=Photosystem II reaction center protein Ycf12 [Gloeobacter violaceus PCC 7421]
MAWRNPMNTLISLLLLTLIMLAGPAVIALWYFRGRQV